jgi:hypothetical protein
LESTITKSEAISILKEKKDLLDLGVISNDEFEKTRETLSKYIIK